MELFLIILLIYKFIISSAASNIDLLYINDKDSKIENFSLNSAIQYLQIKHNITINKKVITGGIYNYEESLSSLCDWYSISAANKKLPDVILDFTKIGEFSQGVQAFASRLDIPFITTSYERNSNFQISPPANEIPSLIRNIVAFQDFSTAAVLADNSYVLDHKYKSLLENIPTRHTIFKIDMSNNIEQLLKIKRMKLFNIFLLGSLKTAEYVLSNAEAISMFAKVYSWHVITHDNGNLTCDCRKAKIFFAQPQNIFFNNPKISNMGFDKENMLFGFFYFQVSYITMLSISDLYRDVLLNGSFESCEKFQDNANSRTNRINFKSAFVKELGNSNLETTLILLEDDVGYMNFSMHLSMIHFKEGMQFKVDSLGYSVNSNFLHIDNPTKFSDYKPKTLYRIVTRVHPPFIYRNESKPNTYYGLCIDLIDYIADEIGFDYEIIEVVDGQVGYLQENGNWNGMINELVTNRADIAIGAISVTSGRESVIDFTVPYYEMIGHSILMKYPKSSYNLFKFLEGFDSQLWFVICVLYFCTSFLIWLFYKFSPFGKEFLHKNRSRKYNIRDFNLLECLFFCLTSATRMGGGRAPSNISSRVISGVWWFFIFIIISSYTANLAAVLTVQRFEFPIRNLDDLEKQYKITYAPLNGSDTMIYFQRMAYIESILREKWLDMNLDKDLPVQTRSKFSVWEYPLSTKFTNMWLRMQRTSFPSTNEEALRLIRASHSTDTGFAFLLDAIDAKYFELINCDLEVISEFNKRPLALAVQKGSLLKDKFNKIILNMYNTRAINTIKDRWWTNNPNRVFCLDYDYKSVEGIIMRNMGGVFVFLLVGLLSIALMLATKYFWAKYKMNKKIISVNQAKK